MSRYERTGWRDEAISARHRVWGFNCPAVDLDFLMVEYNMGEAVALVEYKERHARTPDLRHPTYRALRNLSDRAGLPFILAFYDNEHWWFRIQPINAEARNYFDDGQVMSELEYVRKLYVIRSRAIDEHVIRHLNTYAPPSESKGAA